MLKVPQNKGKMTWAKPIWQVQERHVGGFQSLMSPEHYNVSVIPERFSANYWQNTCLSLCYFVIANTVPVDRTVKGSRHIISAIYNAEKYQRINLTKITKQIKNFVKLSNSKCNHNQIYTLNFYSTNTFQKEAQHSFAFAYILDEIYIMTHSRKIIWEVVTFKVVVTLRIM